MMRQRSNHAMHMDSAFGGWVRIENHWRGASEKM